MVVLRSPKLSTHALDTYPALVSAIKGFRVSSGWDILKKIVLVNYHNCFGVCFGDSLSLRSSGISDRS